MLTQPRVDRTLDYLVRQSSLQEPEQEILLTYLIKNPLQHTPDNIVAFTKACIQGYNDRTSNNQRITTVIGGEVQYYARETCFSQPKIVDILSSQFENQLYETDMELIIKSVHLSRHPNKYSFLCGGVIATAGLIFLTLTDISGKPITPLIGAVGIGISYIIGHQVGAYIEKGIREEQQQLTYVGPEKTQQIIESIVAKTFTQYR